MISTIEMVFGLISCLVILNFFIAYLVFAQKTVHPIEKKIKAAGGKLPQWDGVGFRITAYSTALIIPVKIAWAQLVDEATLRQLATKADRIRAWYLTTSLCVCMVCAVIFIVYFDK